MNGETDVQDTIILKLIIIILRLNARKFIYCFLMVIWTLNYAIGLLHLDHIHIEERTNQAQFHISMFHTFIYI